MSITALDARIVVVADSSATTSRNVAKAATSVLSESSPSFQSSRFINYISSSTDLAPVETESLIDLAAMVDSFVSNSGGRNALFNDLAGAAIYMGNTNNEGYPKYGELIALRTYGGKRLELAATKQPVPELEVALENLTPPPVDMKKPTAAQVQQAAINYVEKKLDTMLQETRGVSVQQVRQEVEANPEIARKVVEVVGAEKIVDGVGKDTAPKPKKVVDV